MISPRKWNFKGLRMISTLGYEPSTVTFSTLNNGLCLDGGRVSEAVELVDHMVEMKFLRDMVRREIAPYIITFNGLIDSFVKERKLIEAKEVYNEMITRGIDPDTITYNTLIYGLCSEKRFDKAMLDLMVTKGCDPDIVTCNILIN
ncbi:Pentatricopeptide repeat-containing protein [Raphanus sativus]|nr:Pentatricopeptide repeat-containing protein [Raphanus sativus]